MPNSSRTTTEMTTKTTTKTKRVRKQRAPKRESAPAEAAPAEAAPVEAAPAENTVAPAEAAPASSEDQVEALKNRLTEALQQVKEQKSALQQMGRDLVTLVEGLVKDTNRVLRTNLRKKRRVGTNQNGGFQKPMGITKELSEFLRVPTTQQMSRTDVTKAICEYIRNNNLNGVPNAEGKVDGRLIRVNSPLAKLLHMSAGETLKFTGIQSKITPHLVKTESA